MKHVDDERKFTLNVKKLQQTLGKAEINLQ
jgi:hypothetical protein